MTTTGNDSNFLSPGSLALNADVYKHFTVRMKVTKGTIGELFFKAAGENFVASKVYRFEIGNNTDYVIYNLDLTGVSGWTGLIHQLRLDPTMTSGAILEIDYIRIY